MTPQLLNVVGGTQPDIYQGTVDAMVTALMSNPTAFWQKTLARDGPIEVWEINGERWLFNGNHRYQAAIKAGVEIPEAHVEFERHDGTAILTWRFDQMIWMAGTK